MLLLVVLSKHMCSWQEIPGSPDLAKPQVDSWVGQMAEEMGKYYETTESLKATLKARGLLK